MKNNFITPVPENQKICHDTHNKINISFTYNITTFKCWWF